MNYTKENLKSNWVSLCQKYTTDIEFVNLTYDEIELRYNDSKRHYHNFEHLIKMFNYIDLYKNQITDLDSVLFSVWFHDYEYNFIQTNNEEISAEHCKNFLKKINYDREKYKMIYKYILRTGMLDLFKSKDEIDLRIFLDSDILILASDVEDYLDYSQKIRQEFIVFSDLRYNPSRVKFLKTLLKNKHIFHLHENREKFDQVARLNISNEIKLLMKTL